MVAHVLLELVECDGRVGAYAPWHLLGEAIHAEDVWQIPVHAAGMVVEEAPHTCLTDAACAEVVGSVCVAEREFGILAAEVAFLSRQCDDVLGVEAVLLVSQREAGDACLVSVGCDAVVRHASRHPHGPFAPWSSADHLEHPHLVGVGQSDALALRAVAIGLHEARPHVDGLACRAGALQCDIHERAIIEEAGGVHQLFTSSECRLHDAELLVIDLPDDAVGVLGLRNLAEVVARLVVIKLAHLAGLVVAGRIEMQEAVGAIGVGTVGDHH